MPSLFSRLLVLLLLVAPAGASPTTAEPKVVRVVLSEAFPPISFIDRDGQIHGLTRDRWELWQERTGIPVKLEAMDWLEAQKAVQDGRADVIAAIASTPERRKVFAFTDPYMEVDVHLYYDRKLSGIVNMQTSKAFTVGVRSGDVCIEKLKEAGHQKFRVYPDYDAMIDAASAGDLPVFCMNELPANYILGEKGLSDRFLQSPAIYTSALYEAVRLDNAALRDAVIAGFKKISAAELSALEEKWLGTLVSPRYGWFIRHGAKLGAAILAIACLIGLWSVSLRREVRRRTQDLAEASDVLASTIEAIPDPLIELSADGLILAVHSPRRELLTRPASEQVDRNVFEVLPQEAAAQVMAALAEAHRDGFSSGREIEVPIPRGSAWFELSVSRRSMAQGGQPRFLLLSRDITTRKHDAQRIARLNRLYSALSHSNQAIARIDDATELLRELCQIAVTFGDMKMAWAGFLDPLGHRLQPLAWAGAGTDYLLHLQITTDPTSPHGRGPLGTAMRERRPIWCQDFQRDPSTAPWHEQARVYGWGSVAALPLQRDGSVVGGIALYSAEANGFDLQSQELLIEMVRDIDFALDRLSAAGTRRRLEQEVAESEFKYRELTESIQDVIWTLDPETFRYLYVSPSVKRLRGFSPEEVIAQPFEASLLPDDARRMQEQIRAELEEFQQGLRSSEIVSIDEVQQPCQDGSTVWTEVVTNLVRHPRTGRIELHGVTRDITERKFAHEQITRLSYTDPLTGLANRLLLRDRLRNAIELARKHGGHLALLNVDLDGFKTVNDSLGYGVGDRVLIEVARRLEAQLRPGDTVSRAAGDEFLLLLSDADAELALPLVQRLIQSLAEPYHVDDQPLYLTASIGVAIYPDDGVTIETLLSNADAAMHQGKDEMRNSFRFFTPSVQQRSARQLRLSNALHRALELGELELLYQPQAELHSRRIFGAEALLRWNSSELGPVSPAEFIPIAEANGMIVPIGDWVLRQAVRDAVTWPAPGSLLDAAIASGSSIESSIAFPIVSVNISAVQFRDSDLTERVLRILKEEGLDPSRLELELTESVTLGNPERAILLMDRLYGAGIQLAIDDFGTGYSSLSYLKRIRTHKLKIDQSFVRGLEDDADDRAIVLAIINLARAMGLRTIAEGVETEAQIQLLAEAGCDEIQGYVVGKPMTNTAFRQMLLSS